MGVDKLKVSLVQLRAGEDKSKNLRRAEALIRRAVRSHPDVVLLPECFDFRGKAGGEYLNGEIAEVLRGKTARHFQALARELKIALILGSMHERTAQAFKIYNTTIVIDRSGRRIAHYRKRRLFDARLERGRICEAAVFAPGKRPATAAIEGFLFGCSICYDLRFPEMFRVYARKGCDIIIVPSNFMAETGKAHWEVLLRARAIENQCYVVAPNQCGTDSKGCRAYGNSMVVDPWGKVIARADGQREQIITAVIDKNRIEQARRKLPSIGRALK